MKFLSTTTICLIILSHLSVHILESDGRKITRISTKEKARHYYKGGNKLKHKGPDVKDVDDFDLGIHQKAQGARIVRSSHFSQTYRLGFKILLVCAAEGVPLPRIRWFKDGSELQLKLNTQIYEEKLSETLMKAKIEIDPATVGDQGLYWCVANNRFATDMKSFKTAYDL